MFGSKILLKLLKNVGVDKIFGIVGREGEAVLFDEDADFVLVRHEETAGIAAEVNARLTDKAQACFSTLGPGVTNLSTGVASAFKDGSPLIAIAAQVERNIRHPEVHQYLDNVALMKPITKLSVEPESIEELIATFKKLPAILYRGKPGPVFISICIDLLKTDYPIEDKDLKIAPYVAERILPNTSKLKALYNKIKQARQPLILAGGKAMHAAREVAEFATAFNIPVGTSLAGKGVISEQSDLSVGTVTKYWSVLLKDGLRHELFAKIDLLILIGFDYAEDLTASVWDNQPTETWNITENHADLHGLMHIDSEIEADIGRTLADLCHMTPAYKKELTLDINKIKQAKREKISDDLTPYSVFAKLRELMRPEDLLISDVGMHKHFCALFFEALKPNTYFCSNCLATMGFGLPAVIGTHFTSPQKRIVLVCGDGSFHSVSQDITTCVKYRIHPVVILFNDSSYGLIRYYQQRGNGRNDDTSTKLARVDFPLLAKANGGRGFTINTLEEFETVCRNALSSDIFTLLEIPLNYATLLNN